MIESWIEVVAYDRQDSSTGSVNHQVNSSPAPIGLLYRRIRRDGPLFWVAVLRSFQLSK